MLIRYQTIVPADCTSDPHVVGYGETKHLGKRVAVMLNDIVRVCASDMVQNVRVVRGMFGGKEYESDCYETIPAKDGDKRVTTPMAKKHRVDGLYWFEDAHVAAEQHLPPGISGLKAFVKLVLSHPEQLAKLSVGVIWTFVGDSSCSDYIELNNQEHNPGMFAVNYGCQDWWRSNEGYVKWCDDMSEFLDKEFPRDPIV